MAQLKYNGNCLLFAFVFTSQNRLILFRNMQMQLTNSIIRCLKLQNSAEFLLTHCHLAAVDWCYSNSLTIQKQKMTLIIEVKKVKINSLTGV